MTSYGERRYPQIANLCQNYKRPFSVLDISTEDGLISSRLANEFEGVFTFSGKNLLNLCIESPNNKKIVFLQERLNLNNFKRISEVHYFDVILVNEPFQEPVPDLINMCSYYLDNKMHLFKNPNIKKIKRCWSAGPYYEPGKEIIINPSFDSISVRYQKREENRAWLLGMNLRTFLENGGAYPTKNHIFKMINEMEIKGSKIDLAPHNIIIGENKLHLIDQDDHTDPICHSKESLKFYLTKNFFQFR